MKSKYTANHTLNDIQERHANEESGRHAVYNASAKPHYKQNHVWDNDVLRGGVERFFLLKNDLMRLIMEDFGEYAGEIDYGKTAKITFKSAIKGDKADWNNNFTEALIQNFGTVALGGNFPLPAPILNYLKSANMSGYIQRNRIGLGNLKSQYQVALERVREMVKQGFPEYTAIAITGMTWTEDSWRHNAVNVAEANGKGAKGTGGANAGEGIIGFTFIPMKIKAITAANLWDRPGMGRPSNFAATYNFGISKLDTADQVRLMIGYAKCNGKWSHALLNIKEPNNDLLRTIICCAAYRFKSGDSNWPGDTSDPYRYINGVLTGAASSTAYRRMNGYDGFSNCLIMAYLLAAVIKAENTGTDWKAATETAIKEIESVIGPIR